MKGSNKSIVFLLVVLMMSSVLIFSEAHDDKKDGGGHDKKAAAPAPGGGHDKKAGAPSGGGGDHKHLNCVKLVEKIRTSKEKIDPAAKQTCGRTVNVQICEWTVMEMHKKEPQDINPKTITSMQMKVMQELIILTAKDCTAAGKDKAHETCAGSYKKALDEIAGVKDAANIADTNDGVILAQGVMKHVQECQVVIDSEKVNSPLKEVNEFLTDICENIISLASAISTGAIKAP